uniref:Large ribosomal subunit protein uL18c n=1 Tax=Crouania attenuata TaxID=42002 RepID=A0A4D6WT03_9FLOR|nr:ribosomal protein L18 [Crouania attenuata]
MRKRIKGNSERPRLYVFKSNKHLYVQVIDDKTKTIITSSSTISKEIKNSANNQLFANCYNAKIIGKDIAQKSKNKGLTHLIFDRGHNIYHGKIKELANAIREEGIIL